VTWSRSVPDVLVVGGGPAGLATALHLRQAGLEVVVCERRAGTVDKACGEGLMPGALAALQRLGVDPPGAPIAGITYRDAQHVATADFRRGPGRGVRRTTLHDALRVAVDAAGIPVLRRAVDQVDQDEHGVQAAGIRARYLVGADGLHSTVRRLVGLGAAAGRAAPRYGLRRHFAITPWTDHVEVWWGPASEAYLTPVDEGTLGVAFLSTRRAGYDEQLAAHPALSERLGAAPAVTAVRGAGPLRQRSRRVVAGRVLLVGDAAGYVDALTGEGIAVSLTTGRELTRCLVAGHPEAYDAAWRQASRRYRVLTQTLLSARRLPGVPRAITPLAARWPAAFSAAVDQLAR
jgi:flavin-dependent dehydrogenase